MGSKNYLFICRDNFVRSKVGARYFKKILNKKDSKNVYSAGVGFLAKFLGHRLSKGFLKKIDVVFVMQKYMKQKLIQEYDFKRKIVVLNIPNIYWIIPIPPFKSINKLRNVFREKRLEKFI